METLLNPNPSSIPIYETAWWVVREKISDRFTVKEFILIQMVNHRITDFLTQTFVESEHIISMMNINTLAIKVNAIRKFSPTRKSVIAIAITMQ